MVQFENQQVGQNGTGNVAVQNGTGGGDGMWVDRDTSGRTFDEACAEARRRGPLPNVQVTLHSVDMNSLPATPWVMRHPAHSTGNMHQVCKSQEFGTRLFHHGTFRQ